MKQATDKYTIDLLEKSIRVRSQVPNAQTPAQRVREFRQRRKFNFLSVVANNKK